MTCHTCNGWGIVMMFLALPPSTAAARKVAMRAMINDPQVEVKLKEAICPACCGYGTRPDLETRYDRLPEPT